LKIFFLPKGLIPIAEIITYNWILSTFFPHFRPIGMSTKESQLKFEPRAVALRKTFQHNEHTHASTDSSVLLCPSCNFQTRGSLEDHHKHHEQKFGLQCPSAPTRSARRRSLISTWQTIIMACLLF